METLGVWQVPRESFEAHLSGSGSGGEEALWRFGGRHSAMYKHHREKVKGGKRAEVRIARWQPREKMSTGVFRILCHGHQVVKDMKGVIFCDPGGGDSFALPETGSEGF